MEKSTYLYFKIAQWFATNPPGTPIPEWCELSEPIRKEKVLKLIEIYEKENGSLCDKFA